MSRTEILIGGVGGQGVVLSGILMGTAATLFENKKAVQTQSYSSELRGGSARAEVIISEEPVSDPQVRRPDILIALAEEAIPRYVDRIKSKGLLVIDSDLVKGAKPGDYEILSVPATSIADKEMGNIIVANLIILGALMKKTGLLSVESMEKAIEVSVPKTVTALNLNAFRRGLELPV
ncbi:MAG TPA: 2-oxoacid:acceptor oxidoreductase family protein [Thermodesulfobacteriota bacterium]|nr:2-oxoacid:acceptor oxidoreductase family protein [Thermodesulfobacteriota bacterium]